MAQLKFRGNLAAKVFPFLSSQFGQTVIVSGQDQSTFGQVAGDSAGGDNNIPQAYYLHNVMPTAQGYKSVGYRDIVFDTGVDFDRVIPIRDPSMVRGWLGITLAGKVYMYTAGDSAWTNVTAQVGGWKGGDVTVAYANGYTYICFSKFNVFKIGVAAKTIAPVVLAGLITSGIVAITASAGYLIVTDGITVYWSSTLTAEDFVPSQITGAGSGKPSNSEGLITTLAPLSNGFAVYTAVNVVIASYSQNARFPWIFREADNSKGVANIQHIASSADAGTNYAWTSAGLQKISTTGAVTTMPEVSDFLAGKEFEDFNTDTNTIESTYVMQPLKVKLAFIGGRYLVISYGITSLTHALVYDTSLKRWGKLKIKHAACFEFSLNSDFPITSSGAASAKKTLGLVTPTGSVKICNFDSGFINTDAVLITGKYQITRSRTATLQEINIESVDNNNVNFSILVATTLDGKTQNSIFTSPTQMHVGPKIRSYAARVTGVNHSLIFKGAFSFNSLELTFTLNGRR